MSEESKRIIEQEFSEDEDDPGIDYVDDPAELSPIGDEEVFSAEINAMVAEDAPRLFALCEEIGDRVDAGIIAWGLSFDDHTEVVYGLNSTNSRTTVVCGSVERAYEWFAARLKVDSKIRIVWVHEAQEQVKSA